VTTDPIQQTRDALADIPRLWKQLPSTRYMARLRDDTNTSKPTPGSRPPLDTTLLDLKDGRDIQWWINLAVDEMVENGTEPENVPSSRRPDITEQCRWLSNNTEWIAEHNPDYHTEIRSLHWMYRRATGHTNTAKLKCLTCGNRAFIDGIWLICTEVEEHARTIQDIEHEHRYRAALPAQTIADEFHIDINTLRNWKRRRKLREAGNAGRANCYYPWDVMMALNPVLAEAINARDEHTAKEPA